MTNTSETEELRKLEIMFANQLKLQVNNYVNPKNLTLFQRREKMMQCWDAANTVMNTLRNHSVQEMFYAKQGDALMQYVQLFTWAVNVGVYIGIDPTLLFNIYKFQNEERTRGSYS